MVGEPPALATAMPIDVYAAARCVSLSPSASAAVATKPASAHVLHVEIAARGEIAEEAAGEGIARPGRSVRAGGCAPPSRYGANPGSRNAGR